MAGSSKHFTGRAGGSAAASGREFAVAGEPGFRRSLKFHSGHLQCAKPKGLINRARLFT
jgi:hypothetical protein